MAVAERPGADLLIRVAEAVQPGAALVDALREQQRDEIALFKSDLDREFTLLGQLATAAAATSGGLLMESWKTRRDRLKAIIAQMHIDAWTETRLVPLFKFHYKRVADLTFKLMQRYDIPATLRDNIEAHIIETGGKRVGLLDIKKDTLESLLQVVNYGRMEGLSPLDTAKFIQDYVPQGRFVNAGSAYRSQLIARTEALHAQRLSSIESYKSTNTIRGVIAFDGDGDEECGARNGRVFTFDEAEVEMDLTHPNCVLCFAPAGT